MATERPILSVSEIKRDVRLPVREQMIKKITYKQFLEALSTFKITPK